MQKGIRRAVKVGGIYYRVYKHHGEIQVSRGVITASGTFEPFNQSSPWLTKNPEYTMVLAPGKRVVLCENENDIPEAIELVKSGYTNDISEKETRRDTKNPTIEEAIEILQNGSHNYKDERYGVSYGMALGALKALDELLKKAGCDKSIEEAFNGLDCKVKELLTDLAMGKITIAEYEYRVKELADKQNAVSYEFSTTETEFNVIRHAVANLLHKLNWALDSHTRNQYIKPLTSEERWSLGTERAAARELLYRLEAVKGDK